MSESVLGRRRSARGRPFHIVLTGACLDPIERLKEKSMERVGIDVDTAIERLEIGEHDPDTYMKLLKQSVEQNDIRVTSVTISLS